jgi:peptidoglycan/LPS O-acetylase OafA/YrhL
MILLPMAQIRKNRSNTDKNHRILFFDLLKITCIAIIVYDHSRFALIPWFNNLLFGDGQNFFNIYVNGITGLAVYGLIFVSGALLEYNYKKIDRLSQYRAFLSRRLSRLYPAFWMSLVLALILSICFTYLSAMKMIQDNLFFIVFEYTGFYVILGHGLGFMNLMGWFIAAIVSLYLLFPWLSKIVKKYRMMAILAILLISLGSRWLFYTQNGMLPDYLWRWFPLCNLFEFSLGIYLVQNKFYPENQQNHPVVHQFAELTFYVFLFHIIIIHYMAHFLPTSGPLVVGYLAYFGMMGAVLVICWIIMMIDTRFQHIIRQNETVKRLLAS